MRYFNVVVYFLLLLNTGCAFLLSPVLPMPATWFRFSRETTNTDARAGVRIDTRVRTSDCVFLLLPGLSDNAQDFIAGDYPRIIFDATGCDSIAAEANYRYYGDNTLPDVIYRDVVFPAERRGYRSIWLLGMSMGGMAAMMVAAQHPSSIDGVVLLAPHVGYGETLDEVRNAGSLAAWQPEHTDDAWLRSSWRDAEYPEHIWTWLKRYHSDPNSMPKMFLIWGDDDEAAELYQLIATELPEGQAVHGAGAHEWPAWTPHLPTVLSRARRGASATNRSL